VLILHRLDREFAEVKAKDNIEEDGQPAGRDHLRGFKDVKIYAASKSKRSIRRGRWQNEVS